YTHPVWNEQDGNAARAALQRLAATRDARRAKAPTRREQAYLDAVEILYGDGSKAVRDTAYSLAMGRLVARFPADREAKVFYALSLLGLNQGVRDVPSYLRAAAIVDTVFRENPNHPGAAHLLIHSYDDPIHAPLGLAAARAYSKIAPDAAHAQHMTTHIFLALGMWDEVVSEIELTRAAAWSTWPPSIVIGLHPKRVRNGTACRISSSRSCGRCCGRRTATSRARSRSRGKRRRSRTRCRSSLGLRRS